MSEYWDNEERNLSNAETLIMKAIWDEGEDIAVSDLMASLRTKYGKDYARTTVATFLLKLSDKGFIRNYRKGKLAYVHAVKTEKEYRVKTLKEDMEFWHHGNMAEMVSCLIHTKELSEKDRKQIRRVLDGLDD